MVAHVGLAFVDLVTWSDVNLDTWSAKMQVRADVGEPVILDFTDSDSTITHVDGSLKLYQPAIAMAACTAGQYYYDLIVTGPSTIPVVLLKGLFSVRPTITEAS